MRPPILAPIGRANAAATAAGASAVVRGAVGRISWASTRVVWTAQERSGRDHFRRETRMFFQHHFILSIVHCTKNSYLCQTINPLR
jgi:hypothetical protein